MSIEQRRAVLDFLDVGAKVLIAAVAGSWILWTYPDAKEKEFRKTYWDHQMELLFQATEAAAKIATLPDGEPKQTNTPRSAAIDKFWELYWGPLVVVEAKCERCDPVAQAMIRFGACLTRPGAAEPSENCDRFEMQNRSHALAKAARDTIGVSWDKKLKALSEGCPPEGRPCP